MNGRYSEAQLLGAISSALSSNDLPAVVALMRLLAVEAPGTASVLYDTIQLLAADDPAEVSS